MAYNIYAGIRKDQPDKTGNCAVYIYIYNGSKYESKKPVGEKVPAEMWDDENKQVKRKHRHAPLINSKIQKAITDIKDLILKAELLTDSVNVKAILRNETTTFQDLNFYDFCETQIKEKNYADETRRSYVAYISKLKDFKKPLYFSQIDYKFLQSYEAYLRDNLNNSENTIWANFKFIATMTNDALKMNKIEKNPFAAYKRVQYKNPEKEFLTAPELAQIEKFVNETHDAGVRLVGKYFLFMAYTGLRHSDAMRFKTAEHVINNERIVIETQKTKKVTNLYINDKIRPHMDFISTNPIKLTQVDFNRKLKVIAAGAGINKKVSSHVARHSFGSSLVDLGIQIEVAKGLLSHGSINSTKIYYHLKAANFDEAMRKFNTNTTMPEETKSVEIAKLKTEISDIEKRIELLTRQIETVTNPSVKEYLQGTLAIEMKILEAKRLEADRLGC